MPNFTNAIKAATARPSRPTTSQGTASAGGLHRVDQGGPHRIDRGIIAWSGFPLTWRALVAHEIPAKKGGQPGPIAPHKELVPF